MFGVAHADVERVASLHIERVFFAAAGGADIIAAHQAWHRGEHCASEVSITFSSQIEDFASEIGAQLLMISTRADGAALQDGPIRLEHLGKAQPRGWRYHVEQLRYCWKLLRKARAFKADIALIDSGVTHFFLLALFPVFGIRVVPILHNCLWPRGFRPSGLGQRIIQALDAWFWRNGALAAIAVSPEAERQVGELSGPRHCPVHQIRAQFDPVFFESIPPPPQASRPFHVMYIGRVTQSKGVLDIPAMAAHIENRAPGLVRWTICGRGDALGELQEDVARRGLERIVATPGWVSLDLLKQIYAEAHASIIPTRSGFAEGLAMTAAEAILAGRPIISNPIVPALELLAPAAMAARSNDPESHAEAVMTLAQDSALYASRQAACAGLGDQFYDRDRGLAAVLQRVLS